MCYMSNYCLTNVSKFALRLRTDRIDESLLLACTKYE